MPDLSVLTLFFWTMLLLFLCLLLWFRYDLLEPAVLMTGTMALSAFCAMMTQAKWNLALTGPGFLALAGGMLAFAAGSIFAGWRDVQPAGELRVSALADVRSGGRGWLMFAVLLGLMAVMAWQSKKPKHRFFNH